MNVLPRLLLALLLTLRCLTCAEAQSATRLDVEGEWRNGEIGGFFQSPDGCSGFQWFDRTVTLLPVPGHPTEFRGVWSLHIVAIWTAPSGDARLKCRWGSETEFKPYTEGLSRQSLNAHLDGKARIIKLTSRLIGCTGMACPQIVPEQMQKAALSDKPEDERSFALSIADGKLIDQEVPQHFIVLRRMGDLAEMLSGGEATRLSALRYFDASDFAAFENLLATGGHPTGMEVIGVHSTTGRIAQRATTVSMVATIPSVPGGAGESNSILYVSQAASGDGRHGTEIMILVLEGGKWKVALLHYC